MPQYILFIENKKYGLKFLIISIDWLFITESKQKDYKIDTKEKICNTVHR